jgi:hypothetical protein
MEVVVKWRLEYHNVNLCTKFCELRLEWVFGGLYEKHTIPYGSITVGLVSLMSYLTGIECLMNKI